MISRFFFCLSCFLFLFSAACQAEANPKIGISLPLSGSLARMGNSFRLGIEMYQDEHPGEISSIDLLFDDHRYDGKQSISSFHQLTAAKKIDFFVAWGNLPAETLAPIAESTKVPSLFLTNSPVARDRRYVVAMGNRVEGTVQACADFLLAGRIRNPAALSVNLGNAMEVIDSLKARLSGNLLVLPFEPDLATFQPLILKMKKASVDGLVIFALPEQALTYAQQARTLKFAPATIGGDVFADQAFLEGSKSLFSSISFVYGKVSPGFIRSYRKESGNFSFFFEAASGYALASLIYRQIGAATPRPRNWAEVLKGADLGKLPLLGARIADSKEDGLRLECDSTVYRSEELLSQG